MDWLIAAFLVAHALIHMSYLAPAPPRTAGGPEWPFELTRSWTVSALGLEAGVARSVGAALVATTVVLFVLAALATVGWLVPASWWAPLVVAGAGSSLLTLALFFHPWLVLGIAIDAGLLWLVLVAGWVPIATAT
jgi:hypothetical protein